MAIILMGLALIAIVALILLAMLRAGIRRQERCRCLTCQPPSLAAALTRRLLGLYVRRPFPGACHHTQADATECESFLVPDEDQLSGRR
jgi:hypothetical protein